MNNKEFIAELARQNGMKAAEAQQLMNSLISALGECFQEGDAAELMWIPLEEVRAELFGLHSISQAVGRFLAKVK